MNDRKNVGRVCLFTLTEHLVNCVCFIRDPADQGIRRERKVDVAGICKQHCSLTAILTFLLSTVLILPLYGSEKLVRDFKADFSKLPENMQSADVFVKQAPALRLDGRFPRKGNYVGQNIYFTAAERKQLAGKNAVLKFKAKRLAGSNAFSAGFRILKRKSGDAFAARMMKFPLEKKNVWYDCEVRFNVPDHPDMGAHNINFHFGQTGNENVVIIVDEAKVYLDDKESSISLQECYSIGRAQRLNQTPLILVKDGRPQFRIAISEKPDEIAVFAAKELQHHFKLATGQEPKIIYGDPGTGPAIYIGDTTLARRYGVYPDMLPPEHFVMARVGKDIILSGGDGKNVKRSTILSLAGIPLGTLDAVYEFCERILQVRWYWPGDRGMVIPPCRNLEIKTLNFNGSPYFSSRTLYTSVFPPDKDFSGLDQAVWKRRMRFGGKVVAPIANHGFQWLVPRHTAEKELFTLLRDGSRKADNAHGVHVCFSSPRLLELTVQQAIEEFKAHPEKTFFPVMPGDAYYSYVCNCPECRKQLKPERGENGYASDMVWGFVNKVARKIAEKMPGKGVKCCAYENYKLPPSFMLEKNVAVTICHGSIPWAGLPEKESLRQVLDLWEPTGAKLFVWEYWLIRGKRGSYGAPVIFPRHLQELYAMKRGRIAGGVIELCGKGPDGSRNKGWSQWEYDLPCLYFAAKLMWNSPFDMEAELDRFYKGFFGPAAETMKTFYENLESAWDRSFTPDENGKRLWNHEICWHKVYPPEFVDWQMALFRKACKEVGNVQPYAWRLHRLSQCYRGFEENSNAYRRKVTLNPSQLTVPLTTKPPVIDGKVGKEEWNGCAVADNFIDSYGVYPAFSSTTVCLLHDADFLYVGIKASPKPGSEVKFPSDSWGLRDSPLWDCDSVECFFASPGGERYQFIFACGDRIYDARYSSTGKNDSRYDSSVQAKTSRNGNDWCCEAKIPLADLKFESPLKNGIYKVNFARNHYRKEKDDKKYQWEQTCWQPTFGAFSKVDKYGTMILKGKVNR